MKNLSIGIQIFQKVKDKKGTKNANYIKYSK